MLSDKSDKNIKNLNRGVQKMFQHFPSDALKTATLALVPAGNPKGIRLLKDLGRAEMRLSTPNPQWEGAANQIGASLRKAGGEKLYQSVYQQR
jgi:molybdate transport system substrate-binding protein